MKSTEFGDSQGSPETQPSCRGVSAVRLRGCGEAALRNATGEESQLREKFEKILERY